MKKERYTPAQVIKAVRQARGNVSAAAAALKANRNTVMNYAARYPEIQEAIEEQRAVFIDDAETALYDAVMKGEGWAVCFALKTIGKSRGYVERQEITGANGAPLQWEQVMRIDDETSDSDTAPGSD